jgi:hypothetical protein
VITSYAERAERATMRQVTGTGMVRQIGDLAGHLVYVADG